MILWDQVIVFFSPKAFVLLCGLTSISDPCPESVIIVGIAEWFGATVKPQFPLSSRESSSRGLFSPFWGEFALAGGPESTAHLLEFC